MTLTPLPSCIMVENSVLSPENRRLETHPVSKTDVIWPLADSHSQGHSLTAMTVTGRCLGVTTGEVATYCGSGDLR